jgi:hypothetical protein
MRRVGQLACDPLRDRRPLSVPPTLKNTARQSKMAQWAGGTTPIGTSVLVLPTASLSRNLMFFADSKVASACTTAAPIGADYSTRHPAFGLAIFWAMENSSFRSLSTIRLHSCQNLTRNLASLPVLPQRVPEPNLRFGRWGSLGGSSRS